MQEPGLDRHEWVSEWEAIEEELAENPSGSLTNLDDLVARMLGSRGYALADDVASEGDDPEILAEFRAARDVTRLVDSGQTVDPGDVASAINGYRALYEHVLAEHSAP